jgi:peptidoglycan/xylan/chitin deacetylase (PgdA/CDA1 family)
LKATFFVPGWTAEKYQNRVEAMLRDGHEVGHHGYLHEWIDPDSPDREREALEKGLAALKASVGVRPKGYRSPAGETSQNMVGLLAEHNFLYDSSLQDDIRPYQLRLSNGAPGPIELPWHWSVDDAPYMLFSLKNPRPIMTNSHVLEIWREEFQEIYRHGGLFNLVCHPQVIGRPSRLAMLREFIAFTRKFPRVWYATGREVAEAWIASGEIEKQEHVKIG